MTNLSTPLDMSVLEALGWTGYPIQICDGALAGDGAEAISLAAWQENGQEGVLIQCDS